MENFDLIYNYLDNNLNSIQEDVLFDRLNKDSQLRTEFKSLLDLKNVVAQSDLRYDSPASSKEMLFNNLGLGSSAIVNNLTTFVLVPTLAILSLFGIEQLTKHDISEVNIPISRQEIATWDITLPELVQINGLNEKVKVSTLQSKSTDNPIVDNNRNITMPNSNIEETLPLVSETNQYFTKPIYFSSITQNISSLEKFEAANQTRFREVETPIYSYRQNNFRLEFSNSNNWHSIQPLVAPDQFQNFNNTNIRLFYDVYNGFEIGLAYARENFSLKYRGEEDGQLFDFYQQPNYSTIGLVLAYNYKLGNFEPFANIETGYNASGTVLRTGLGLRYNLSRNFGVQLNGSWNGLFYNRFGNQNLAEKYQLNYGLFIRI